MRAAEVRAAGRLVACRAWRRAQQRPLQAAALLLALLVCLSVAVLRHGGVGTSRSAVEVDAVFVTDCSDDQEVWAQVFLSQWRRAGSTTARLTRILACGQEDARRLEESSRLAFGSLSVFVSPEPAGRGGDRHPCSSRPRALWRWLRARPTSSRDHWVALLDPDMLVLRPTSPEGPWRAAGGALATHGSLPAEWRLVDVPPGVALAQRSRRLPQLWQEARLSLAALCADARDQHAPWGCQDRLRGLFEDPDRVAADYAVGLPTLIRAQDLWRMADAWRFFAHRTQGQHPEAVAEALGWVLAARHARVRFGYLDEAITDPGAPEAAWRRIDAGLGGDPCAGEAAEHFDTPAAYHGAKQEPADGGGGGATAPPWLLHLCEAYAVSYAAAAGGRAELSLDPRQLPSAMRPQTAGRDGGRAASHGVGSLLNCSAPALEMPPRDLLSRRLGPVGEGGGGAGAIEGPHAAPLLRRSAWVICLALRALNTGLREHRLRACPVSAVPPLTGGAVRSLAVAG
ncbi:unnamed protein product, partial [Prorocentrum cordatum]